MRRIAAGITLTLLALAGCHTGRSDWQATVYLTAKDSNARLQRVEQLNLQPGPELSERDDCVFIDPGATFQSIVGIGGALTDAAAETYAKLPADKQSEILRAYFDPQNGIGYSLGRTNIHSCDFSSESYTYVQAGDFPLATFDIAHDMKYRVPFIKAAMATAGKDFVLYASPWSPPAWMKTNGDMLHGGKLKPEAADSWARYFVKFVDAYERQGIPIWGLTVQNEPLAVQTWESCIYTAEEERDFVKNHLGPALRRAGLGDRKLVVWDHNRGQMFQRASVVLDDPEAAKYVWGVGFHWYVGDHFENVRRVQERYPRTHLLFTEGCVDRFTPDKTGEWKWGEMYGRSMIHDFNNGAVGWTDWNVLLDEKGGPNHVANFCFAPIHGNTATGELTYLNSYYYIGHFSKFVRPGARRIVSSSTSDDLLTTAFLNTDGTIAVVVMNATGRSHDVNILIDGKNARTKAPAHSIATYVLSALP
jgi:glucosylceramidase